MPTLGERQIRLDCDVIQADGGTRTAGITGAWVALRIAIDSLLERKIVARDPMNDSVAAISCGIVGGAPCMDLDYAEDSGADADANFVLTGAGGIVEIQGTAETRPFGRTDFDALLDLAQEGVAALTRHQMAAVGKG